MKQIFSNIVLVVFIIFGFLACVPEDDTQGSGLKVSEKSVRLDEFTNMATFTVESEGSWYTEIPSSASWVRLSPRSGGEGITVVTVKASSNNTGGTERSADITVNSDDARPVRLHIVQPASAVRLDVSSLSFNGMEDGTGYIELTAKSGFEWEVRYPEDVDNLTVSPSKGNGSADLTVRLGVNPTNKKRSFTFSIASEYVSFPVEVSQSAGPNHNPTAAVITSPENGAEGVFRTPVIVWEKSTDPDDDQIAYYVEYRKESDNDWIRTQQVTEISYTFTALLDANAAYVCRVVTEDVNGGVAFSEEVRFTTNNDVVRPDGEVTQYTRDGLDGQIPVIFIGDGFSAGDFVEGGHWDTVADKGIENFFATEPYRHYRNCFTAWKVVAHSAERGCSRWRGSNHNSGTYVHKVNTRFNTKYYGDGYTGTYMTTNDNDVFTFVSSRLPRVDLSKTVIVLIVNDPVYSGTCWNYWDGRGIGIVPLCEDATVKDWFRNGAVVNYTTPYTYRETMAHEAAGHGFGRLADEYKFADGDATQDHKNGIANWWNATPPMNLNVDYRAKEQCNWHEFFGREGYEHVGYFQGAQYDRGIYMSEDRSVMRDMWYCNYNAASRLAIVKRIYQNMGWTWNFEEFIKVDKETGANGRPDSTRPYGRQGERRPKTLAHTPPQMKF